MIKPIPFLMAAVAFHFREDRIPLLTEIVKPIQTYANKFILVVITNAPRKEQTELIHNAMSAEGVVPQFMVPTGLGHPFLLPWSHLPVFKKFLGSSEPISHFMYLEDDIRVERNNVEYWLQGREFLRPHSLIPSFLRVERKQDDSPFVLSDHSSGYNMSNLPFVAYEPGLRYVNLPKPYQGMYLLDRELMQEYFAGPAYNPDFKTPFGTRESAAQGITFTSVPRGYTSRNLLLCHESAARPHQDALIHHASNTYALKPSPGGKGLLPLDHLFVGA